MASTIQLHKGDCLDIMPSIPDKSVDMILCDLPYGTTNASWDIIIPFDELWKQYNRIVKPNGAIVLFGCEPFSSIVRTSNLKTYKYDWVWNKKLAGNGILAKKQPLKIHENIMVFNTTIYQPIMRKGKMRRKMTGGMKASDCEMLQKSKSKQDEYINDLYYPQSIIEFSTANMRGKKLHIAEKPVALLEYLIKTYTNEGETVLDNCMGSGSTGVACMNTNRKFIGIEKEKKYYDIAKKRVYGVFNEKS